MRKSLLKLLGVIAGLAYSVSVFAVGLGGINVTTALGQRLKADIELVAVDNADKSKLVARLAPSSVYKSAGLEYPYGNNFKFQIESRDNGGLYIKVSSAQPINDPFVSLLVELSWPSGKLSREYTFLLDPPGYMPEQPAQAEVQAVAPETETKQLTVPEVSPIPVPTTEQDVAPVTLVPPAPYTEQVAPAETTAQPMGQAVAEPAGQTQPETSTDQANRAVPETAPTEPLKQAAPVTTSALPEESTGQSGAAAEWISVNRGDTLYKLADQYKLADMNLERLLVALYRVNAKEFTGNNMNRIRAGKVLKLPDQSEYDSVTLAEAKSEIRAQAADWNAYRQKLAGAATVSNQTQTVQQIVTGKINSSVADRTPIAKETAKEVLKLSKGEAPGDQVGAGGKSAQELKNAAQEDAIAKEQAAKEEQMRVAMLEEIRKKQESLAQLKAQSPPRVLPAQPQAQKPGVTAPVVAPVKKASDEKVAAKPKPKAVKSEPSLTDQILEDPVYLAGGAGAILVLGGVGFVLYKRKKKAADEKVENGNVGETTGSHMVAPVIPSPDTGDFTSTTVTAGVGSSDTVDPISEADLFLNFGRDTQAEEILKDALKNTPNNHQIHLKLLGIYANRKDANAFASIARQLQDSGDDAAWQQAAEMGSRLEPNNPMYGGSKSMEDTGSSTVQVEAFDVTSAVGAPAAAAALDFDFDAAAASAKTSLSPSPEQDFLGAGDNTMVFETAEGEKEGGMDFDVTATHAGANPSENSGEMVFDITGSHASPEEAQPSDDGGMAFTLDFPVEDAPKATPPPATVDLAGISLNFDDAPAPDTSRGGDKGDHWQEVSTKLDLAKAYMEMGDSDGAREILNEVLIEGDTEQQATAQTLFAQLG